MKALVFRRYGGPDRVAFADTRRACRSSAPCLGCPSGSITSTATGARRDHLAIGGVLGDDSGDAGAVVDARLAGVLPPLTPVGTDREAEGEGGEACCHGSARR